MSSPTLFDYAEARRLRDDGMSRATDAQEYDNYGWGESLYLAICAVARRQEYFFVDDVSTIFSDPPAHPNAAGAPWQRAIRAGMIERTGKLIRSARKSAHAHNYPQYRSKIYAGGKP